MNRFIGTVYIHPTPHTDPQVILDYLLEFYSQPLLCLSVFCMCIGDPTIATREIEWWTVEGRRYI